MHKKARTTVEKMTSFIDQLKIEPLKTQGVNHSHEYPADDNEELEE